MLYFRKNRVFPIDTRAILRVKLAPLETKVFIFENVTFCFQKEKSPFRGFLVALNAWDINPFDIKTITNGFQITYIIFIKNKFGILEICQIEEFSQAVDF